MKPRPQLKPETEVSDLFHLRSLILLKGFFQFRDVSSFVSTESGPFTPETSENMDGKTRTKTKTVED